MKKINVIFGVLLIFFSFSCQDRNVQNDYQSDLSDSDQNSPQVKRTFVEISARQADDLIAGSPDVIVIDISDKFEQAHIWNAKSYPLSGNYFISSLSELDKTKPYIIYGHDDDSSSVIAAQIMVDSGFNEVYRISGDLNQWIVTGLKIAGGSDQEQIIYYDLEPRQVLELQEHVINLSILDFSDQYGLGHLPGAINYPLSDSNVIYRLDELNKSNHYLIYAGHDSVSLPAASLMVEVGFTKVYRLKGNLSAWIEDGLEIVNGVEP